MPSLTTFPVTPLLLSTMSKNATDKRMALDPALPQPPAGDSAGVALGYPQQPPRLRLGGYFGRLGLLLFETDIRVVRDDETAKN